METEIFEPAWKTRFFNIYCWTLWVITITCYPFALIVICTHVKELEKEAPPVLYKAGVKHHLDAQQLNGSDINKNLPSKNAKFVSDPDSAYSYPLNA